MSYIYKYSSNFDLKIMAKYVWGDRLNELALGERVDHLNNKFVLELGIQTGKYWGDILFTNGFETLLKKSLYDKMAENGFVNGYKTFKVINTVKGGPEYVGIVITEDGGKADEKYITYVEKTWGKSPIDFKGHIGIEKGNDIFGLENIPGDFISEKLYNFLQENADVENVEFKQIECI